MQTSIRLPVTLNDRMPLPDEFDGVGIDQALFQNQTSVAMRALYAYVEPLS